MNRFSCSLCSYHTNKKSSWDNHIASQKHIVKYKLHTDRIQPHICKCGKSYKHISSLSRHKLKCNVSEDWNSHDMKSMFNQLLEDNKKLHKQIEDLSKQPKIIQNNKFNIVTFLNKDCKDAMNLSEFIQNYPTTFEQLEWIEKHGYTQGVQNTIVSSLKDMDQSERPIHCMDKKRKIVYIKDNNLWEKDNNCEKLSHAIQDMSIKAEETTNGMIKQWRENNPEWKHNNEKSDMLYTVTKNQMDFTNQSKGNKLVNRVINTTMIDKNIPVENAMKTSSLLINPLNNDNIVENIVFTSNKDKN